MSTHDSSFRRLDDEDGIGQTQQLVSANDNCALMSLFAGGLVNTVLVQMLRGPCGSRSVGSVYAVYREDGVVFEDIVEFDMNVSLAPVAEQLRLYVRSDDFEMDLLSPLVRSVRRHFKR